MLPAKVQITQQVLRSKQTEQVSRLGTGPLYDLYEFEETAKVFAEVLPAMSGSVAYSILDISSIGSASVFGLQSFERFITDVERTAAIMKLHIGHQAR